MGDTDERKEHLYDLLKDFDNAMLVTRSGGGQMHARPMAIAQLKHDADAYFVSGIDTPKIAEIERDPNVTLTFQSAKQYASVCGRVSVVRDQSLIERLWKEAWKIWFPKGKTDPTITLLKFDAEHAEYWDNAGAQGLKYAFKAAAAYMSSDRPEQDEKQHAHVELKAG
jgi:general stress protein 26